MLLLIGVLATLYVSAIGLLVVFQGKIIFPAPTDIPRATPATVGLGFEDLHLAVDGKTQIHAWWVPAPVQTKKVLLYFHGNGQVLEDEAQREVALFHETGANLLMVEYRGYGGSSALSVSGITMAEDARTAMRYLEQNRGVTAGDVVICGWSIGSGVAARLALETPNARGLILFSAVTSMPDVANQEWIFRYPLRPAQWFVHANDFATKNNIGSIHMPLLLMTGRQDSLAPPWMAELLFARANEPKRLALVDGAEHNDLFEVGGAEVVSEMKRMLGPP